MLYQIPPRFERQTVFEDMKTSLLSIAGAITLCASLVIPATSQAANFQVVVKRASVTQCTLTGSMLNIDPATGNISLDLETDFGCYPPIVSSLANSATLTVVGPTTIGGGTSGTGDVNLTLSTGLPGVTPGVTCVPDGVNASNAVVTAGWSTPLCSGNCGSAATRTVTVQNPSSVLDGNIVFKAKCTYQDQSNANLSSIRANIQSSPVVTVQHGTAPVVNYCSSVSELATPNGLNDAGRQFAGLISGGTLPGTRDFHDYTNVFGFRPNVVAAGDPDNQGFGFPGNNPTSVWFKDVQKNKYISLKFRAPSSAAFLNSSGSFFGQPVAAYTLFALAPCPGQFSTDSNFPIASGCSGIAKSANLPFRVSQTPFGNQCQLIPGKTYYFNIIQADGFNSLTSPSCGASSCGVIFNLSGGGPQ